MLDIGAAPAMKIISEFGDPSLEAGTRYLANPFGCAGALVELKLPVVVFGVETLEELFESEPELIFETCPVVVRGAEREDCSPAQIGRS